MAEVNISELVEAFLRADPAETPRMLDGPQGRLLLHPAVETGIRKLAKQAALAGNEAAERRQAG